MSVDVLNPNGKAASPAARPSGAGKAHTPPERVHHLKVPVRSTLTPPSVRLVLCLVCAWEEKKGEWQTSAWTATVLAVHSRVEDRWECTAAGWPAELHPDDRDALRRAGWQFCERIEAFGVVFLDAPGGLGFGTTLNEWDTDGNLHQVVACPWPEAEDGERLKPVLAQLAERALDMAKREEVRKAEARKVPR